MGYFRLDQRGGLTSQPTRSYQNMKRHSCVKLTHRRSRYLKSIEKVNFCSLHISCLCKVCRPVQRVVLLLREFWGGRETYMKLEVQPGPPGDEPSVLGSSDLGSTGPSQLRAAAALWTSVFPSVGWPVADPPRLSVGRIDDLICDDSRHGGRSQRGRSFLPGGHYY